MINLTDNPVYVSNAPEEPEKIQKSRHIKSIMGLVFVIIPLLLVGSFVFADLYYINLSDGCVIILSSQKTANTKEVTISAIKQLRDSEKGKYRVLCENISHIRESYCIEANDDSPNIQYIDTAGCYLKGTKTVFLTPAQNGPNSRLREDRIKALSTLPYDSKSFWETNKQ